ncbi:unnamed protein product [Spirodela intermedia]|uniref:SOSEKI DIX-like domain-containing protein n=1 Tax=Spirodela intermedia TaxID=51605 RepID=A0A7I8IDF8_SPIIN|nr:unnamed protein product [Spirodela intermedia]CAA6655434.1 unnamed protein product [Spirodela intermedia]
MEGRTRRVRTEPPPLPPPPKHEQQQQQKEQRPGVRRIPVVYYLCRNMHLEHPHFIEVPSSPEGLYLRDVINRLNALRGKGMAAMYSWSCKRSYKSGFVWHDLSEDDLILPAQGNEYVLKGSEILNASPSDRPHQNSNSGWPKTPKHLQQGSPTPSSQDGSPICPEVVLKEVKPPRRRAPPPPPPTPAPDGGDLSPTLRQPSCSRNISPESQGNSPWGCGGSSPGPAEFRIDKDLGALNASTQTNDRVAGARKGRPAAPPTRTRGVSTDEPSFELKFDGSRRIRTRRRDLPPSDILERIVLRGKTETLESLIRADARKTSSFRMVEEEVPLQAAAKLKATDVLMQLITCGSISVKDNYGIGIVSPYKPRISQVKFPSPVFSSSRTLGELDCLSENPRMGAAVMRMEEKEYFSGSLIETKRRKEGEEKFVPTLKRSSSYNAERNCKSPDPAGNKEKPADSTISRCLHRTSKTSAAKQTKNETTTKSPTAPDGRRISSAGPDCVSSRRTSKRFTEPSPTAKCPSPRTESFREEKEKIIKIEES